MENLRLTFEILHNIEKLVIHIRLLMKLNFNLIEIGERVLQASVMVSWEKFKGRQLQNVD